MATKSTRECVVSNDQFGQPLHTNIYIQVYVNVWNSQFKVKMGPMSGRCLALNALDGVTLSV
jgi:hypothetical protein